MHAAGDLTDLTGEFGRLVVHPDAIRAPNADRYVARIFDENNYSIVNHVKRLPERSPAVFAALTR